jgi:hypothetical protein
MEAELACEGAIILKLSIAVAAGVVHFIAALPGEVDAVAAGVAVISPWTAPKANLT